MISVIWENICAKSYEKFKKSIKETSGGNIDDETLERLTNERLRYELKGGVQTIQYQINTLMTTNGQSPFVTLFLNLQKDDPYLKENAMIVEEILPSASARALKMTRAFM